MLDIDTAITRLKRRASWAKRITTAPLRALPDFVIIGAQKAGTSSLYDYLTGHPNVAQALRKEVHYFDLHFNESETWYRAHFPRSSTLEADTADVTGEATPDYLYHPRAAERIHAAIPDAKLIVLLRDPVDRALSHFHHERARGREPIEDFAEAIRAEGPRLEDDREYEGRVEGIYSRAHRRHSYVARGMYAAQLERYLRFFPREQLLVLFSERMFAAPEASYKRVLDFLELPEMPLRDPSPTNVGEYDRRENALEELLRNRFAEPNRELAELLGEEPPWPKPVAPPNGVPARD